MNVSDPGAMKIVRSLELDADYVSARLVGTIARVVTVSSMPQPLPFKAPADGDPGGERRRTREQPRTRGHVPDRQLAAFLQGEGPPRGDVVAPARSCSVATCGVPPCTPGSAC